MSSVLLCFLFSLLFCATFCLEVKAEEPPQFAWMIPQPKWYFNYPQGIAIDGSGNVYVADTHNDSIQKFSSNGTFLAKWGSRGSGDGQFNWPIEIAIDGSGDVYVADNDNYRIQKFSSNGTFLVKWGSRGSGDGQFNSPAGIAIDGSGNVYVADAHNDSIQKFSSNGTFLAKWGSSGSGDGQFNFPRAIAIDGRGNVYVADRNNHRIQIFSSDGTFLAKWGSGGSGDGQFNSPEGIAIDGSGNVYVADIYHRIQKFSSNGTFLAKWGNYGTGDGQFNSPRGIAIDGSGNVYVADAHNDRIQKFSSNGTFLAKWGNSGSGDGQFSYPCGIAIDGSGNVYVTDTRYTSIQKFSSDGTFLTKWGSDGLGDGQFSYPRGIAIDGSGNVYVADTNNGRIQKFSSNGTFLAKWGSGGSGDGQFNYPKGIAIDGSGNVYVVDAGNHRIQKFGLNGAFLAKWGSSGSGDGQFNWPWGIAIDGGGNVYVTDNQRIQKFSSNGIFLAKWGNSGSGDGQFNGGAGIAIDGSDNVYVTDSNNHRIQKFSSNGTFLTKWGSRGSGDGQFISPRGIAIDGSGNVYVADLGNNRIQKFTCAGPVTTLHIFGYVRNDTTKQPMPNAQISIGGTTGFTNQKGYYWINNIEEGTFAVIASVKGYKTSKQFNIDVVENMVTSEVNFLMESGLGGEEDFQGTYCQVYLKDSKPDETFIVKLGDPGAGNLGAYTAGKIEFEIDIDRYYGELQDPNDPNMAYLKYPDMLKNNKIISAHLELMMYDIDPEEFNTLEVNGHMNVARVKEDMNNSWTQITVAIPIDVIKFPKMGSESIPPSPRKNKIVIHIDEEKGYKTRCDWAALTIKGVRPIVFIHGKGSNSLEWSFGPAYGEKVGKSWHNFKGNFDQKGYLTEVVDYWPEDNPIRAAEEDGLSIATHKDKINNDADLRTDEMSILEADIEKNSFDGAILGGFLRVNRELSCDVVTTWYSVKDQMSFIKNKYGVDYINIIAHSMGGLVGRAYANYAHKEGDGKIIPKVDKLFMIGTPNKGTTAADYSSGRHKASFWDDPFGKGVGDWLLWTPAVEYLTTSYVEKEFNEKVRETKGVHYYTIAGAGGYKTSSIADPWHWFANPYDYNDKIDPDVKKALFSWKLIKLRQRHRNEDPSNDNLVPVESTKLDYADHIDTFDENHHTIRDNPDIALKIIDVLSQSKNYSIFTRKKVSSNFSLSTAHYPYTGTMNTKNSSLTPNETQVHTLILNQCEEVFFSLSWLDTSQNILFSVIDPNNHIIATDDPNVTLGDEPGFSFYSISNPKPGTWQLLIDSNNLADSVDYSLTTIIMGNGLSQSLVTDKDFYRPNVPIFITQTLKEWENPILDANITVSIIDPNHNKLTINLLDDGTQGDTMANDGVYSNTVNSFTIGGSYSIAAFSQGVFSDETEFSNTDFTSFSLSKEHASFTGDFTEKVDDTEGDGLYNTLVIEVSLDVLKENSYLLVGELQSNDGRQITWSKISVSLLPGLQHIDLTFDGNEIFSSGIDGPYYLKNLTLWPEEESNKLDGMENAYITGLYTHRQFQRDKITIITENISDRGIDGNTNGKYDFLEINIAVDIINEAEYIIDASLTTVDGQSVASMNRSYYLYPGINMVSVHFLGKQIYNSGQNGPYVLENFSVSNTNDNFIFNENLYNTTIPYQYTDFDKPAPNPPTGLLITPDLKSLHLLWNQGDEDVAGYKIYYGEQNGDYEYVIDANDSLSYQLTDLEGGKKYFIALTAYNGEHTESGFSVEREVAPQIFEGDTDGDGLPDTWENTYENMDMYDPNDAIQDYDQDELDNINEYQQNTDPGNPDSDSDGFFDGEEVSEGSNPVSIGSVPNRSLAIFYGWPSAVNNCPDLDCAIATFSQYRIVILGGGLEHLTHGDHEQTKTIISALHSQPDLITVYGYIDLGLTTSNLSMENINLYADEWKTMGADGIFFDDAGWDFEVGRARLNQAVECPHNHGMNVIVNAWNPDDVLSDTYHETYNPDNLPTQLQPGDGYLYESYQISQGRYQDFNLWAEKADKCLTYKNTQGIKIYCVALGGDTGNDPDFQEKFDYFWWSFLLYGFDYYQYTNLHYSASNGPYDEPWANSLLYHHPDQPRKYIYTENTITHICENYCHTRLTSDGGKVYLIGDGHTWGTGGISQPPINLPPIISSPTPLHESINQPTDLLLAWNSVDPDGDEVTYNLFFGQYRDLTLIYECAADNTSYLLSGLDYATDYEWQIKATDSQGAVTIGPVWKLTTQDLEICDGVDNDGDDQVDEDFPDLGQPCIAGVGECMATGIMVCTTDGSGTACDAILGVPQNEIFDGLDNDCDGKIDEGCVNNVPSAPALNYPMNDEEITSLKPMLSVSNSIDPDGHPLSYTFEIYSDQILISPVALIADVQEGENTTTWEMNISLNDNSFYYWRACANDGFGYSVWMDTAGFFVNMANEPPSIPRISSPPDQSDVTSLHPILEVNNANDPDLDAITYEFKVFADQNLAALVSANTNVMEGSNGITSWQIDNPLEHNASYFWRAQARDNENVPSGWTNLFTFLVNTSNNAPTAPTINNPVDGEEVATFSPTLTINNSVDADLDDLTYFFEVDKTNTFNAPSIEHSPEIAEEVNRTSWHPSQLDDNTVYYWRARAYDGAAYGQWLTGSFFVNISNDSPSMPIIYNPRDNTQVDDLSPTLVVESSIDADHDQITYEFELYEDTSKSILVTSINNALTSWPVDMVLVDNGNYYWRVRAVDEHGAASDWTAFVSFLVNINHPPTEPTLNNPVSGGIVTSVTPTLSVNNARDQENDVLYYEFEVYADKNLASANNVTFSSIPQGNLITSWQVSPALNDNTTYYWRVRANDSVLVGSWMSTAVFMVNTLGADTIVNIEATQVVSATLQDKQIVEVVANSSPIKGVSIEIPSGALLNDTTITIGMVTNPPALPSDTKAIGKIIEFGPSGIAFLSPVTIMFPYTQADLENAGVSDPAQLEIFTYDTLTLSWEKIPLDSVDIIKALLICKVDHFSIYTVGISIDMSSASPQAEGSTGGGGACFIKNIIF